MAVVESVVKLGLGKDKLGSSKSKESGVREKDHKKDNVDGNGNSNNGGNGKPRVRKKKPKRKRDKLKFFLYDGSYMLKKCLKKSMLKKKPMGKALILDSSARGVKAKEAKSEKKPVECFLCHAVVKGKATSELGESSEGLPPKEQVSLSSNLEEEVVMKIVKLGPTRLKSSEASELAESSTRLPPVGEVGDASGFKGKEEMQVGQLT
ncbi:hypothetical protein PVK06_005151 [Gossypium arboreum]|uniref:Uncharacterized protein n=1 Tax=Gossypium arboreum TaxID=29729 RepID=A0ABR0QTY5_GOSAR|nr:hypothetical protein PVK06_005151 [Gossypium arboreum]